MDTNLSNKTDNEFRSEKEREVTLTKDEREHILSADPSFSSIEKAVYFDNYDLPCPVRVEIKTKEGNTTLVVLRKNRHGEVQDEVAIIKALDEYGLPVPKILVEPFTNTEGESSAVYSLMPGENLQKLSMRSEKGLQEAKNLLVEAVGKLAAASEFISNHEVSKILPRYTLESELEDLNSNANPWFEERVFIESYEKLAPILKSIKTPLILSNGDYQPGNFLAENGKLTGFLDFESPSFQDPLMGFVKYPIYDLLPLSRTDLIDVFLQKNEFLKENFNIRLALGCLKILKKEIPISGGDHEMQAYRERVLKLLLTIQP